MVIGPATLLSAGGGEQTLEPLPRSNIDERVPLLSSRYRLCLIIAAAADTLAIVAYEQPTIRADLRNIRGHRQQYGGLGASGAESQAANRDGS